MPQGPPPQPQPQSWPLQGMQPPADRVVDPDGPATDTGTTSTDGESPGWTSPPWSPKAAAGDNPGRTPPPWSPDAARPSWKLILGGCLIAAIVLLGPVGWLFDASRSATGEHKVATAEPTQVSTEVATPDESEDLNSDEINVDDSVDLRVGDCFNLKDPDAEIEHVRKVSCKTEHDYELFYVGAMRKRSHPTEDAILDYVIDYCDPAFGD